MYSRAFIYNTSTRFVAILWTVVIFLACVIPGSIIPEIHVPFIDKYVHFILFGVFSLLWLLAHPTGKGRFVVFILLISILYGVLLEIMQGIFTVLGRAMQLSDMLANSIGALMGVLVFLFMRKPMRKASGLEIGRGSGRW